MSSLRRRGYGEENRSVRPRLFRSRLLIADVKSSGSHPRRALWFRPKRKEPREKAGCLVWFGPLMLQSRPGIYAPAPGPQRHRPGQTGPAGRQCCIRKQQVLPLSRDTSAAGISTVAYAFNVVVIYDSGRLGGNIDCCLAPTRHYHHVGVQESSTLAVLNKPVINPAINLGAEALCPAGWLNGDLAGPDASYPRQTKPALDLLPEIGRHLQINVVSPQVVQVSLNSFSPLIHFRSELRNLLRETDEGFGQKLPPGCVVKVGVASKHF